MEEFSEEHSKLLLGREWLTKIDTARSTPYFIKYYSSTVDLSCFVVLTDTKSVWAEVLTSKQLARRWRIYNPDAPLPFQDSESEDEWRTSALELLSSAHTIGGIIDLSFEIIDSSFADCAVNLECEAFKWRWETCFLGYKPSSDFISKHLIFPLISVNHLAFTSPDILSEVSDADMEKAVDKVGRTARRTIDTHIKNAIARPRVTTTIRRMTAMFNFLPDIPKILSVAEKPDLQPLAPIVQTRLKKVQLSPDPPDAVLDDPFMVQNQQDVEMEFRAPESRSGLLAQQDSATESEPEETNNQEDKSHYKTTRTPPPSQRLSPLRSQAVIFSSASRQSSPVREAAEIDSSPLPPVKLKKPRLSASSDNDSEEERKRRVTQLKSGSGAGGVKRGTRQPIKRGGKRF